jgi:hypothetical protein
LGKYQAERDRWFFHQETRKLRGKSSHRKKAEMSPCIIKSPLRMICAAPHKKGASNRIDKAGGAKTQ